MKGFLAVARREIEEKRFVFFAAAVASLAPFAVPLVRRLHGAAAVEARDWLALMLASTFAFGLALGLGSTVVASDLAGRRLGFYFSRPVTGAALWAGKLGAAIILAFAAAAIVFAPTLAADGGNVVLMDLQWSPLGFIVGIVATILVFHAGNILMRPRSPLLAFDVAALLLLTLAVVAVVQKLPEPNAERSYELAVETFMAVVMLALALAGLLAVTRGRTDSRGAHRTLSATLWGALTLAVVSVALFVAWVFSSAPRDLVVLEVLPSGRGTWMVVYGSARGADPVFLYDAASGHYTRTGWGWQRPILSPDGTFALWFNPSKEQGPLDTMTWKLDDTKAKPVVEKISFSDAPALAFLSAHGERLATIENELLSIYELPSGASLGAARVEATRNETRGFFVDTEHVRILRRTGGGRPDVPRFEMAEFEILEFDTAARKLVSTGSVRGAEIFAASFNASGNRLLLRETTRLTLRDGRSGALIATLTDRGEGNSAYGRFLGSGQIAVGTVENGAVAVTLFSSEGHLERTIPIPGGYRVLLGSEAAPGKLIVAPDGDTKESFGRNIFVVDLTTGDVRQVAEGLLPIVPLPYPVNQEAVPGSPSSKLFYGPGASLVFLDALTGQRRALIGKDAVR